MSYTVIGHFDCGCGQAAQPESMEVVVCQNRAEANTIVSRMTEHSAQHQCWVEPAMAVVVVRGRPQVVHEVKQSPQACVLFPDFVSYIAAHEQRKQHDKEWNLTTRAEGMKRLAEEHRANDR